MGTCRCEIQKQWWVRGGHPADGTLGQRPGGESRCKQSSVVEARVCAAVRSWGIEVRLHASGLGHQARARRWDGAGRRGRGGT